MAEKFRRTKELLRTDDAYEKALAVLSGMPAVTAVMDIPETAESVMEDAIDLTEVVAGKIFDFLDL